MKQKKISIGQKFGKLTVVSKADSIPGGITVKRTWGAWNCQCACGNTKVVKTLDLNRGSVQSCGCLYDEFGRSHQPGQKFGRLTTIAYKNGKWFCVCDCGEHVEVPTDKLTNGNTKSCGCLKSEISSKNATKLIEERREFEPRIASARRVWKGYCYRDEECTVTIKEFLAISQQNCSYCGRVPSTEYNYFSPPSSRSSEKAKSEGLFIYNGMDRIDSSKRHTIDNIVPCCPICNRAKNDRSIEGFLAWVARLKITYFQPITISNTIFPSNSSVASSVKCVFYNHKNDTDMTMEEYYAVSQMNCFYCEANPSNLFNKALTDKKSSDKAKQEGNYIYNGIDRIDRNLPHNKNNIVPCCYYCNFAKGKLTLFEFQDWIKRVQNFQSSRQ